MPVVFSSSSVFLSAVLNFSAKLPSLWCILHIKSKAQGFLLFFSKFFLDLYGTIAEEETAYLSNLPAYPPFSLKLPWFRLEISCFRYSRYPAPHLSFDSRRKISLDTCKKQTTMYLFHIGRNIGRPHTRRLTGAHCPPMGSPSVRCSLPGAPADAGPNLEQHSGKSVPAQSPSASFSPPGWAPAPVRPGGRTLPPGSIFPPQPAARNRNSEKGVPMNIQFLTRICPEAECIFLLERRFRPGMDAQNNIGQVRHYLS